MGNPRAKILGVKHGRLTPVRYVSGDSKKIAGWICICECGKEIFSRTSHLLKGLSKSCGCYANEMTAKRNYKHGNAKRKERSGAYKTWIRMKRRCFDESHENYSYYGGRGITVCENWLSFENFLIDMGPRPEGMEIDRIDNNGSYEPGNCRWVNHTQQMRNMRRNTRIDTPLGIMAASEACEIFGLNRRYLYERIKIGITDIDKLK